MQSAGNQGLVIKGNSAVLNLGFRPFFAGAAIFSLLSTLLWLGIYTSGWHWQPGGLAAVSWHAHEMIFGYAMAVIAGFLLTAVKNWTGVQTLHGYPLLVLFLLWFAARCLLLFGGAGMLLWAAVADLLFNLMLLVALAFPIFKVRQFKQFGMLSKVLLLMLANLLFYIGVLAPYPWGLQAGLYSGVYLVMALIFVMSRRVLPFFVERGLGGGVTVTNRAWLDGASLLLFVAFWLADILQPGSLVVAGLAAVLCVLHGVRLAGWYARGIWKQPLLWVLFLAYFSLVVGFALKAAAALVAISPLLALHAFTYGGVGLFTLGMMARVTLGHTGRNVLEPPPAVVWIFGLVAAGSIVRVILPLLDAQHYVFWIGLSQLIWVSAFLLFMRVFVPMLLRPRMDGQPG
ncbi:MAG: NnrS family protein [Gammaproteobacteria bacterium]|nr:NnrS family protein [Gammaproteobacteria bacterium]MDH3971356.1 NnrS family protein [Gammaproteobacteria bacterium]